MRTVFLNGAPVTIRDREHALLERISDGVGQVLTLGGTFAVNGHDLGRLRSLEHLGLVVLANTTYGPSRQTEVALAAHVRLGSKPTPDGLSDILAEAEPEVRQPRPLPLPFEFEVPLRTKSGNVEERWRTRARRRQMERKAVALSWRSATVRQKVPALPVVVTVTRIAPSALDSQDNLRWALKSPVDEIAHQLGLASDRDPNVTWRYKQASRGVREYAVSVSVTSRSDQAISEAEFISDAATALRLIEEEGATRVVILRDGKPVAQLTSARETPP